MVDFSERDRVIRAYLSGRTWDSNPEFGLVRELVVGGHPDLTAFPFLYDYEWEVQPGFSNGGCGDLIFADGAGNYAVVEVKFVNLDRTGRTTRVKRTKARSQVREQAQTYAAALQQILGDRAVSVRAFFLTNESGLVAEHWGL